MVYEEHPEWKKLLKEKKYKEATQALMREIGINLMRVHNLYSDNKVDVYSEYKVAFGPFFGETSNESNKNKISQYLKYNLKLSSYFYWVIYDLKEEDLISDCKYIIRELIKLKKDLRKQMNIIKGDYNV